MRNDQFVECGKLGRAFGISGFNFVYFNSDDPIVDIGKKVFLTIDGQFKDFDVAAMQKHGRHFIIRLAGMENNECASEISNKIIYVPEKELKKLSENEFYAYEILGLRVYNEQRDYIGKVVKIFTAGESDVYEVMPEGGKFGDEIMIPAIKSVIVKIDIPKGEIIISPMKGMIE